MHKDFPLNKHAGARPAAIAGRYFATVNPVLAIERFHFEDLAAAIEEALK